MQKVFSYRILAYLVSSLVADIRHGTHRAIQEPLWGQMYLIHCARWDHILRCSQVPAATLDPLAADIAAPIPRLF